jgi:methionyl-tRNA formyltransferase
MQMDAGLDTGDMLLEERVDIGDDSTARLHDRLAGLGGRLIVDALRAAEAGQLRPVPQPQDGISYAHKIEKHEAKIDWTQPAEVIARRIRAFDPFPGASSVIGGELVKLWAASAETGAAAAAPPGMVLQVASDGITVATGAGALKLTELQRPGGKRLGVADFLRGFDLKAGQAFEN